MEAKRKKIAAKCLFNGQGTSRGTESTTENEAQNGMNSLECVFCGEQFVEEGDLNIHLWSHTDQDSVKCPVCCVEFYSNWNLRCHYSLHGEEPPFECAICQERFPEKCTLRKHIHSHSGGRPYQCLECAAIFEKLQTRRDHVNGSIWMGMSKNGRWRCPECGKAFQGKRSIGFHMMRHKSDKDRYRWPRCGEVVHRKRKLAKRTSTRHPKAPIRCQACGEQFSTKATLSEHERVHCKPQHQQEESSYSNQDGLETHAASRPPNAGYRCSACGEECASTSALTLHLNTQHSDDKAFECAICKQCYPSEHVLMKHYLCHFKCSICGMRFGTKQELKEHVGELHTGSDVRSEDKPFQCTVCKKHYPSKSVLSEHYLCHFKCPLCPRIFETQSILNSHIAEHKAFYEKSFQCVVCEETCPSQQDLIKHYRYHFKCQFCPRIFKTQQMLNSHLALHHRDIRSYECALCLASFVGEYALNDHMRDVHSNTPLTEQA